MFNTVNSLSFEIGGNFIKLNLKLLEDFKVCLSPAIFFTSLRSCWLFTKYELNNILDPCCYLAADLLLQLCRQDQFTHIKLVFTLLISPVKNCVGEMIYLSPAAI